MRGERAHDPDDLADRAAVVCLPEDLVLAEEPGKPGTPAMLSEAMRNVQYVQGMYFLSPPIFWMSSSPRIACITLPAPKKSRALKNACV